MIYNKGKTAAFYHIAELKEKNKDQYIQDLTSLVQLVHSGSLVVPQDKVIRKYI